MDVQRATEMATIKLNWTLKAHSFHHSFMLSENCSLLGTDVCGQISEHFFCT